MRIDIPRKSKPVPNIKNIYDKKLLSNGLKYFQEPQSFLILYILYEYSKINNIDIVIICFCFNVYNSIFLNSCVLRFITLMPKFSN